MSESIINVYGANWCSDCRRTKKYLGEQRIHYRWFDIELETPEGKASYDFVLSSNEKVSGKPKRKIPVVEIIEGNSKDILIEPSNYELAERLDLATKATKDFYHAIIIGAGPAGLTAAIYLARDGYDVLVIEQSTVGGQAFITNKLDNFPGFPEGITGSEFATNVRRQAERFGVEILVPEKVINITPCHENGSFEKCTYKIVRTKSGKEFTCLVALIATGSKYRKLSNIPGYDNLLGINIHYCATCDGFFYKDKRIFVIGGGNSAFEESLFLKSRFVKEVTILIRRNEPSATKLLQEKIQDAEGINVWLNSEIVELIGENKLKSVVVQHTDRGEVKEYHPDGIFVFIGLSPNTEFVAKGLELDESNFIITDGQLQSSVHGIFAAGDCRKGSLKQAVASAGEGATAALMMRNYLDEN
ncbi:MAG: FAD-dependent oxidoreductase [Candidatus Heimdallarchaeota archaeon]|nr:MAG: FAD-dependent oxidoreductase [Candidatus Heimdallarchaeota archaeon]